jgi:hypothetical protein
MLPLGLQLMLGAAVMANEEEDTQLKKDAGESYGDFA